MSYRDLREFLDELEAKREIVHVYDKVSLDQEIAQILREVCYRRGPAVLFHNVVETSFKVVGNLFGSEERLRLATRGADPSEKVKELETLTRLSFRGIGELIKGLSELQKFSRYLPKKVSRAPVHEIEHEVDLTKLPAIRQWPKEPSRFFTMGMLFIQQGDNINFGYYRLQVLSKDRLAVHWMPWRRSRQYAESSDSEVEVAIVFGADPVTMLMASVPIPHPLDKVLVTGVVRGEGLPLVRGRTVNVLYPANAELVIEGRVNLRELVSEGPFGDHVGFYSPVRPYPVMEVTGIYSREDAIVPVTVTGKPVLEDGYMMMFGERVVLPILRMVLPEVVDLHMPPECVGYVTIVSIKKRYPGHAKRVMMFLWASCPVLHKFVIVVDHDVNVRDLCQVAYAIAANVNPSRDILIVPDYPTEELDPSTPVIDLGSKVGIDATRKLPEEYGGREYPEEVKPSDDVIRKTEKIVVKILEEYSKLRKT